jgi:hypothetical protein
MYNIIYDNDNFVIDAKKTFDDCVIYKGYKKSSLSIHIDINNDDYRNFLRLIYIFHKKVNSFALNDENMVMNDVQPLARSKMDKNVRIINGVINDKTVIVNSDNDKVIDVNTLDKKKVKAYPIFWAPSINVTDDMIYVNFIIYKLFVKIVKDDTSIKKNVRNEYMPDINMVKGMMK